jgi:antitoxin component YwqK of YwqJK toxin-antitoxin module
MSSYQPVRVPARAVVLLAFWIVACASTEETYYPSYTPPPSDPQPSYTPPPSSPQTARPEPPPRPTLPGYIPELDKSKPPEYPVTSTEVHAAPTPPAKPTDDLWQRLSEKYGVKSGENNPNRGNPGDPLIQFNFELGFDNHKVTLACVAESRIEYSGGGSTKLAHGLGFCTFDNSRATMSPNTYYSLADPYCYCIGYFRDGRMHGPWAFNREDEARQGKSVHLYTAEYLNNQVNGEVRFYDDKGYLTEQCWGVGGVRHGASYQWTANGSVTTSFVGGVQSGTRVEFDSQGRLSRRGQIHEGSFWGRTEFWFPGATYPYLVRYFDFGANRGWGTYYRDTGTIGYQAWFEDGKRNGPWVSYTEAGKKHWTGSYVNGSAHGRFQRFHEEGWMDMDCEYANGRQTGLARWYYKSGKVLEEGNLVDGKRHGEFKAWREDGTLQWICLWDNGVAGKTTFYDAQGNIERVTGDPEAMRNAPGWTWIDNGEFAGLDAGYAALAFDEATGHCVMFGGADLEESKNDMREFDGTRWAPVQPRRVPPACTEATLYFDTGRKRLRLVGGTTFYDFDIESLTPQRGIWEWDGKLWTQINDGASGPDLIYPHGAAFDRERNVLVALGQRRDADPMDPWRTWLFDGEKWTDLPAPESSSHTDAQMVWDAGAGKVALWLPSEATGAATHRAWHFDGQAWQAAPASLIPPDGKVLSLCHDTGRKGIWAIQPGRVLFYDGANWTGYETPALVGKNSQILVDPKSGRVFVHGWKTTLDEYRNDSWWFDPKQGKSK